MSNFNVPISVSTNILDVDIHTRYCETISSIEERRRALLMAIQALANICQFAKFITSTVISATTTAIQVNPYIQTLVGDSALVTGHMNAIMETFQAGTQWDIEYSTIKVCVILAQALKQLPKEGNLNEINAADAIANAYLAIPHPAPTRNNTPEPLPIRIQPPSSINKDINDNQTNSSVDDLDEEVHRLTNFMKTLALYPTPDEFFPPTNYTTFIDKGEENLPYWNDILKCLMKKNYKEGTYRGYTVGYVELGIPNAPHFIGIDHNNNKFIIANTKKALFGVIA
ncbi:hypothetical protein Agabi119p4_11186 [Agaricus bisporus var. burnettii]|uniref:Uncharacterized protein n=1 Tax=Agaricus bisporus var. burnettii TaxID=192524 RepID=A0A8H7EWF9_AGABI|nr:hypothetical protein Agabi119p4_11186 [Agaricus bisporus var. burnettii]